MKDYQLFLVGLKRVGILARAGPDPPKRWQVPVQGPP